MISSKKLKIAGFTIVELAVTISVIAILATIVAISTDRIQTSAREQRRAATVETIVGALESYYEKNGEYPSEPYIVGTVSGNTGKVVAERLGLHPNDLRLQYTPEGVSNALVRGTSTPDQGYISYQAEPANSSDPCQIDPSGGCDSFTIIYKSEVLGYSPRESIH